MWDKPAVCAKFNPPIKRPPISDVLPGFRRVANLCSAVPERKGAPTVGMARTSSYRRARSECGNGLFPYPMVVKTKEGFGKAVTRRAGC